MVKDKEFSETVENSSGNCSDKDLPAVSFIIPTYNEEKRIGRCLKSIFSQDYPANLMEVIIVDGMSSDNTVEIAKKYPTRIIFNEKRIVGNAMKLGVQEAKNNVLAPIPADCELPTKNWLRSMVRPLSESEVAGVLTLIRAKRAFPALSRCYALIQADPIIAFAHGTGETSNNTLLTEKNYFPTQGFILRKDLVLKAGNFKSFLPRLEDVDLTYRLVKLGYKLVIIPRVGIYHSFTDSFSSFLRKVYMRISVFVEFSPYCEFSFIPTKYTKSSFLRRIFYHMNPIGIWIPVLKGIRRHNDFAWLYYPIITLATILTYCIVLLTREKGRALLKRFIKE